MLSYLNEGIRKFKTGRVNTCDDVTLLTGSLPFTFKCIRINDCI